MPGFVRDWMLTRGPELNPAPVPGLSWSQEQEKNEPRSDI